MFDSKALADAIAAHGPVARVVVAGVQGHAPREVGAAMLVWADASQNRGQSGSIGGGALEYQAARAARAMLSAGEMLLSEVFPLGPNLGQCCGGAVRLVTEVFHAAPAETPAEAPAFARPVMPEAGPMPLAIARAMGDARRGQPAPCQLHQGWLIEGFSAPQTPVWIWGAGHVGRAIVGVMAPLPDVQITWVDTDLERFPDSIPDGVRALPVPDLPRAVALAPLDAQHIIVTFSHALDLALCDGLLRHGFAACGVIGSASKWVRFRARLRALGHDLAEISRIRCPIGDPALGKHPQAIAIGVAASMMAARVAVPAKSKEMRA